ncbi:mediator of RNA polymerase II transcription subunit 34 isoform X2 [Selaginella moellendorffii]|uniref:mediator of RNA polymerase II transcription subunit 34 isoform X2 n=1 Tax=Selaginella moellendorffii TaxID=88036 RepID=UPI000D1CE35F|nr:mediator of RNA polymerase II transcription subunit 34 isoform X2 [Selaginella moellendorffii]|eukprot:XP_024516913.1 mediator of RNA polymerase II transcription subunit 34 isoform X2 [Selaginella moellendorffii]
MAEEEVALRLEAVDAELQGVQAQIAVLCDRQARLLEEQAELRQLIDCCRASEEDDIQIIEQDWSGNFEWDNEASNLLLNVFGISTFRRNQREIVNALMSNKNVVVVMAAGGGKSLCYQLPALLRPGIALVVSPLLSLIQDQVMGLAALGVSAAMLTSTTSKEEEKEIYRVLEKGDGNLRILYVTPEKIAKSKRFMSKLEKCNRAGRLSLVAIDEAHCCSQWGHDFRPDYKNLGILKKQFPKVPMIALTATATGRVQRDLQEMLQILPCERFTSSVNRPNLFYEVRDKKQVAADVIEDIALFIKETYPSNESGIVYCFSRKECEQVADALRKRQISAAHYHADMDSGLRTNVHRRWSSNQLQVIVGTVAFGMGINKPDVRFVIHHTLSKSLETYYQESGRAGRDGLPSRCVLYFRPADVPRQSCMVFSENTGLQNLYAMARYCQSKQRCRRAAFFQYFAEQVQECNGMCDTCAFENDVVEKDVTEYGKSLVQSVMDVAESDKKTTLLQLVDLWRSQLRQAGNHMSGVYGHILQSQTGDKEMSKDDAEQIILQLILDGTLREDFQHTAYATNAYVKAGSAARLILQGKRKVILEQCEKRGPVKTTLDDCAMQSGMARMLDKLRQTLAAADGGLFPYAVLSSEHIKRLSSQVPTSITELDEIIGKTKSSKYGEQIITALNEYTTKNTDDPDTKEASSSKRVATTGGQARQTKRSRNA